MKHAGRDQGKVVGSRHDVRATDNLHATQLVLLHGTIPVNQTVPWSIGQRTTPLITKADPLRGLHRP